MDLNVEIVITIDSIFTQGEKHTVRFKPPVEIGNDSLNNREVTKKFREKIHQIAESGKISKIISAVGEEMLYKQMSESLKDLDIDIYNPWLNIETEEESISDSEQE